MSDTAKVLRVARAVVGKTHAEIARTGGVPRVRLSDYEHGRRSPRPEVLRRVFDALLAPPAAAPTGRQAGEELAQVIAAWLTSSTPSPEGKPAHPVGQREAGHAA